MATPSTSSLAAEAAPTPASSGAPPAAPSTTASANASGRHRRRTRLDALLDLASAFLLYWSLPSAALLGRVRFWQLRGRRDDALGW